MQTAYQYPQIHYLTQMAYICQCIQQGIDHGIKEEIVDNFAGGGGASTGIEIATGESVFMAINHDPAAIKLHLTNHPRTIHHCENVWKVNPLDACSGKPIGLAWFSPDCKHFSKAKGGKPKDKNIRGLAWVALKWAGLVRPRVIMLENVEEFKTWGPLNRNHKPIKKKAGQTFKKFVSQLESLGYEVEFKILTAADYGAPTTRKRLFMIARCDGMPIVWPEPTHGPRNSDEVKDGLLKPYVGAYQHIDFSIPCPSIFETSKNIKKKYGLVARRPLKTKTMQRIARGYGKFVLKSKEPFIIHGSYRTNMWNYTKSDTTPILTANDLSIPYIVQIGQNGFTKDRSRDVRNALSTIVTKNEHCLIEPVLKRLEGYCDQELLHRAALVYEFFKKYLPDTRQSGVIPKTEDLSDKGEPATIVSHLIQMNNKSTGTALSDPLNTIVAGDHFGEVRYYLIKYYGQGTGQDIKEPLDTITANDRFALVQIKGISYLVVDIGMRMLQPRELYACQGFPDDYIIEYDYTGTTYPRDEQIHKCGNSVSPPTAACLVKANLPELCIGKRLPNSGTGYKIEETGQLRIS